MSTQTLPPCPSCKQDTLTVTWKFAPKPIGTYSIAGAQSKVAAEQVPYLVCGNCDFEEKGKRA